MSVARSAQLGEILLKKGQVRRYQIDFLVSLQEAYRKKGIMRQIGELMVRHRAVNPRSLEEALRFQQEVSEEEGTDRISAFLSKEEDDKTKLMP